MIRSTSCDSQTSQKMEFEINRLYSFVSCHGTGIQASRLSRNGFYYNVVNKKIVCYKCGIEVEFGNSTTVVAEVVESHLQRSALCAQWSTDHTQQSPAIANANAEVKITDRSNPDFDLLRGESARLATFHDWPAGRIVDPHHLAEAGLFYTGHADRVQCAFCRGVVRNWVIGDKPMEEHRRHFPDCPFVRTETTGIVDGSSTASTAKRTANVHFVNLAESLFDDNNKPSHPVFAEFRKRVESFDGRRVSQGQTAEGLANAGFWHVGPDDNVRCFYCDGGLKNWQPTDDPWTEHARWFPRCRYVLSQKDIHFVQNAGIAGINGTYQNFRVTASSISSVSGQCNIAHREVAACMDSRAVHSAIEMGYSPELVKQVVEKRLLTTDEDFPSTQSLLEAIFEFEDNQQQQATVNQQQTTTHPQTFGDPNKILEENRQLKEARTCKVCMDSNVGTVFLPCPHSIWCHNNYNSSPKVRNCSISGSLIVGTVTNLFV